MTQIDFYVQVDDKHETVRRLCAKAFGAAAKVVVWCPDEAHCQRLSRLIWSIPATGFVPHCFGTDPLAPRTPIVLACDESDLAHDQILINLRAEVPAFFSRFERLIEIVGAGEETDTRMARERFRYYRDRGYEIRTHDMSGNGTAAQSLRSSVA